MKKITCAFIALVLCLACLYKLDNGIGGAACDNDRLEGYTLEDLHCLVELFALAKQRADLTGSAAEYGNVKVAHAKEQAASKATEEGEQLAHLLCCLTKECCL